MNSVERVKQLCKERKIPISKLEKDLGFSNGYISQLRKGVFPADRLARISEYLNTPLNYLMTGKISEDNTDSKLTNRDRRDIKKSVDEVMESLENRDGESLLYDGVEVTLSEENKELLRNALTLAMQAVKLENKEKFNPHKNGK